MQNFWSSVHQSDRQRKERQTRQHARVYWHAPGHNETVPVDQWRYQPHQLVQRLNTLEGVEGIDPLEHVERMWEATSAKTNGLRMDVHSLYRSKFTPMESKRAC